MAVQDKSVPSKAVKWNKTGIITDSLGFQSYELRVNGSNLLTTRNRAHLRKVLPFINQQMEADRMSVPEYQPVVITRSKSSDTSQQSPPPLIPLKETDAEIAEHSQHPAPYAAPGLVPASSDLRKTSSYSSPPACSQTPSSPSSPSPVHAPTTKPWCPQPNLRTILPIKEKWILKSDLKPPSVEPNAMSTVQAIMVTYPVSGFRGEDFTRTYVFV